MVNSDTIGLLKECNSGIKMGVSSIDEILEDVKDSKLSTILSEAKDQHEKLGNETGELLRKCGEDGKEPSPIAKGMSWITTNFKMSVDHCDSTAADIITDGCNMGVKSLCKYLNEYSNADSESKEIANRLINIEDRLSDDLRSYL